MFKRLQLDWQDFIRTRPGVRFTRRHDRRRRDRPALAARLGLLAVGFASLLLGIVMLFTPGPGLLAIAFGITCFAQYSRRLARQCDQFELRFWRLRAAWRKWRGRSRAPRH